jgi:hypothetical protein
MQKVQTICDSCHYVDFAERCQLKISVGTSSPDIVFETTSNPDLESVMTCSPDIATVTTEILRLELTVWGYEHACTAGLEDKASDDVPDAEAAAPVQTVQPHGRLLLPHKVQASAPGQGTTT